MGDFEFDAGVENEDGDETSEWFSGGRAGTIFLIDAAQEMFDGGSEEDEEVPFKQALKCALSTITRKVICSAGDLTAVVFFNTQKSLNARTEFPHIYILQDLDRPGAERVLKLEEVLEVSGSKFENDYGHSTNASVNEALWVCQTMFSNCKSKLATRSVLVFTSRDDPHSDAPQKARQARQRARDMRDSGITIELLHMGQNFDVSKLYKDLVVDEEDEESQASQTLADPTSRLDELQERVRRLEHKQRSSGKVTFTLAPGVEMSVSLYTSITKATNPSKIKLWKNTNEEVRMMKKEYLEETGELLMPSDYVKFQNYSGRKIKFNLDEIRDMNKVYEQGMQLIGFKPMKAIKPYYHVRSANFIYPDEKNVQGSTKTFAALLDRCLARDVAAIVRIVARKNASVAWAALVPQMEEKDDKNCQVSAPGFHVCFLPFADDFRNIEIENRIRAKPSQVDAAKEILKKLHFRYSPDSFENPDLQTHWRNIEALALNRSSLEEVPDYTMPNYERVEKKGAHLLRILSDAVFPPGYDPNKVVKRPTSYSAPAAKKPKPDFSKMSVEDLAKGGMVDKMSMPDLKVWLADKGVRITGKKKPQLVSDVYDTLGITN